MTFFQIFAGPIRFLVMFILICLVSVPAHGSDTLDTADIIENANHVALYLGQGMKGRVHLEIVDKQGRVRQRTLNILRRDSSAKTDGEQKYLTYFKAPADVRKMVFMVHKKIEPGADDDRWLYMPAMDLVKRIAAGDKRTSFVGSDFLYEDISGRNLFEDTHKLIRTTDPYYIIENRPRDPGSVAFEYYLAYIHQKTFITDKLEFYNAAGALYRTMEVLEVRDIQAQENGVSAIYPTVVKSRAANLETGSVSTMTLSDIVYNPAIGDGVFSERYLRRPPRAITR